MIPRNAPTRLPPPNLKFKFPTAFVCNCKGEVRERNIPSKRLSFVYFAHLETAIQILII